jgi:acetyl/propionyl-CoA carboxylase alpha subunit
VPVEFDPMLAKVVVYGATRSDAAAAMAEALGRYVILGCRTNLEFLRALVRHDAFRSGDTTTRFIERHFEHWTGETDGLAAAAAAVLSQLREKAPEAGPPQGAPSGPERDWDPWASIGPWRMGAGGPATPDG